MFTIIGADQKEYGAGHCPTTSGSGIKGRPPPMGRTLAKTDGSSRNGKPLGPQYLEFASFTTAAGPAPPRIANAPALFPMNPNTPDPRPQKPDF